MWDLLWVRGGFPDSFLAANDESSLLWRSVFIQTYLELDVPALVPRIPAETLRRNWQMLAHNQGQMLNAFRLASGLGVGGYIHGQRFKFDPKTEILPLQMFLNDLLLERAQKTSLAR